MTRDIMNEQQSKPELQAVPAAPKSSVEVPAIRTLQRDTLAGAFPNWDLVPQTQFIRRVK